MQLQS